MEQARDSSLAAVADFDKSNLKEVETLEKNPLPPVEAIAQEMEHIKFKVSPQWWTRSKESLIKRKSQDRPKVREKFLEKDRSR